MLKILSKFKKETFVCNVEADVEQFVCKYCVDISGFGYRISSNKHPWRLFTFKL